MERSFSFLVYAVLKNSLRYDGEKLMENIDKWMKVL